MEIKEALEIVDALPNPPRNVATSAAALLSPSYWESALADLNTLSTCLNCLEEQDAVIICRKLANQMAPVQREIILSRCKRIVSYRNGWMGELDQLRKDLDEEEQHQRLNIPSAELFCDKTMARLAADQDLCVWQSQLVTTSGSEQVLLQLNLTQSVAAVLELPEAFNDGTSILSTSALIDSNNDGDAKGKGVLVFRAAPLKRAGTWISPNPSNILSKDGQPSTSGAADEDQILYYLRLYLSLGGNRKVSGEFLSEMFVREVATLLATQLALFDLTQTSGAKFDIAPSTNLTNDALHMAPIAQNRQWFRCCRAIMPSEAVAGRPVGKVSSAFVTLGNTLYDPMGIQLHDITIFAWALKYCYGEVLRRSHSIDQQGKMSVFLPPAVTAYVNEHVLNQK